MTFILTFSNFSDCFERKIISIILFLLFFKKELQPHLLFVNLELVSIYHLISLYPKQKYCMDCYRELIVPVPLNFQRWVLTLS